MKIIRFMHFILSLAAIPICILGFIVGIAKAAFEAGYELADHLYDEKYQEWELRKADENAE